ncbi:hypothetical protein [Paracoccus siganidrum]|uniref:hypothetical protein n=1 Tax=Paracoccus siganidrum TaxID=1276757 RepID=UPI000E772C16|nr:hypothetical protein [Paracoccus siganidrum]RMC33950.1 hypothetical protein C9E82_12290 [Paracoccus siganidrum]
MAQRLYLTATAVGIALSAIAATSAWVLSDSTAAESAVTASCLADCAGGGQPLPAIGEPVDEEALHVITHPGRYGLSLAPSGSRYGVLDGQIVRFSASDGQLLSILRQTDQILD